MQQRFMAIWFYHLTTNWWVRKHPELKDVPFVLSASERGRIVVTAANEKAQAKGITKGMVVADCRAIFPTLQVFDDLEGQAEKLLHAFAEWSLRYTPVAAIDLSDGLILDISGCAHLWGGEENYLKDIIQKLNGYGYHVRAAIADTVGAAWAVARYGRTYPIIPPGQQKEALLGLPPVALRLEETTIDRLKKLGLYTVQRFIDMPRSSLRRRFGVALLSRLDQALGLEKEIIQPIQPAQPYQERLPSFEPIRTAPGIEIALRRLLEALCTRLGCEEKGLRHAIFKGYRIDGALQQISIGTGKASRNVEHLFKLFELKIASIEPDLGIELFLLEAPVVEDLTSEQEALWAVSGSHDEVVIAELLDKIAGKIGANAIHRFLPAEHYWPEWSFVQSTSLQEKPQTEWRIDQPRPVHLLPVPEPINVTVPIPDYPPMLFHYKGTLHKVKKADGPERIEREWWIDAGEHRDYYCVEDENGARYWLFRLGHYASGEPKWFLHGFFA
ncbi:Y-family DNA polymerase [Taibaiella soli]|uniref:DNA polymerase Y family protein n=1 Tax=Taibaiella soli TaxID=1649169 RepID=A0A2W2BDV8_9BACT|nr:DNA polymerase Y family protein [Taibaiella soli]PZF74067.1 DNA polymerase Y family protein [Taibaiella soli]